MLEAVTSLLEPVLGHFSPTVDKIFKIDLLLRLEGPCVDHMGPAWEDASGLVVGFQQFDEYGKACPILGFRNFDLSFGVSGLPGSIFFVFRFCI